MEIDNEIDTFDANQLTNSELIIGLACAIGTDINYVIQLIEEQLQQSGYQSKVIKISKQLIEPTITGGIPTSLSSYDRSTRLMDQGNKLRQQLELGPYSILASGIAHCINQLRQEYSKISNQEDSAQIQIPKTAFIIDSLKHPDEVDKLREIYPSGFYMFVINESEERRIKYLTNFKNMGKSDAQKLVKRDMEEETKAYGQHTRAVFELADFHLSANICDDENDNETEKRNAVKPQIDRILKLIFGNPFITPTFDEYAMFMAYSSGLRSADLSRQIGAIIAKDHDIIATGANDVPCFGGGQYWPDPDYKEHPNGRDFTRGYDSNKIELQKIVDEIIDLFNFDESPEEAKHLKEKSREAILQQSSLKRLTEYGRPVHAEMAALMSCARNGISTKDATLYCSTFPCHNCAKHIISAGIKKVVYIEPYPKSRTLELYNDSITITQEKDKVEFCEFVGIGPRRFYDLFSLRLSTGTRIRRKGNDGHCIKWTEKKARVRCQMLSTSYIDKEAIEALKWEQEIKERRTN